jgi:hypothetical protein
MTAPVTVAAADPDSPSAARLHAVWASLPSTLRPRPDAELVAVSGATTDWPARLADAARTPARAIVLLDPVPVPADQVRALADTIGIPVAVRTEWAIDPAVTAFTAQWSGEVGGIVRGLAVREGGAAAALLLDQLALLRAAVGPLSTIAHARFDQHGHTIVGALASGDPVHLQGVRSGAAGWARVTALGPEHEHVLEVSSPQPGTPGSATRYAVPGDLRLPTVHEDRDRALWRRMAGLFTGDRRQTLPDLAALADDLDRCAAAVAHAHQM